jgi:hypothetical protein
MWKMVDLFQRHKVGEDEPVGVDRFAFYRRYDRLHTGQPREELMWPCEIEMI